MKKKMIIGAILVSILFTVIAVFHIRSGSKSHSSRNAMSVVVTKVALKSAPLFIKTQGVVEASKSVMIQPQVTAVIKKIGFIPGETVSEGQALFVLDSATYEATLAKSKAALSKDEAQLKVVQRDQERYQALVKKGFVSKQEYDQVNANVIAQLSTVKSDEALIEQDQAELSYTNITAPIAGKTGNVTVKEGDLVNASSGQALVTINQLNPIYVDFYLPQNDLPVLMRYQNTQPLKVSIYSEDQTQLLDQGELTFIDNTVNANTGTLLLKASLPNKHNLLWPGEAVSVKLYFTVEKNTLAIPSQAIQTDQKGQFVYVIKDNQAYVTPITVLRQIDKWTFISKGLTADNMIATVFPPNLQDKSPVVIVPPAPQQVQA